MPSLSFPFFASTDSSFLKAIAWELTNPVRKAVNNLTASFSPFYQQVSSLWPCAPEEPFFVQAQREKGFQQYQAWCSDLKKAEHALLNELIEKKLDPKTFRALILEPQKKLITNILSPTYYQTRLIKLEQKFKDELKLPTVYSDIVREAQMRFREVLQSYPQVNLDCFYNDSINHLIQLSGCQISLEEFLQRATYYQGLVPKEIYNAVSAPLEHFIQTHKEALANYDDLYLTRTIPPKLYQQLFNQINIAFSLLIRGNSEDKSEKVEVKCWANITPRFLVMSTIVTLGVYSYQTLNNYGLPTLNGYIWYTGERISAGFYIPHSWAILTQATITYGFYHHAPCFFNPTIWLVSGILSSSFPLTNAQTAIFNLSTLNGINGFVINGISNSEFNSPTVLSNGDINGDNLTDVIIGDWSGYGATGHSYVVFGSQTSYNINFNLTELNGNNGFAIYGINNGDESGYSLSSGDINGDNLTDLLIGARGSYHATGQSYVVFGSKIPFPTDINLMELNGSNGFVVNGLNNEGESGYSLSSGDFNGDNITDLLIGAPHAPSSGNSKGQSYVVFGSKIPFPANFNLTELNGSNGFTINGINSSDFSSWSLSGGDINGDNITDLLIGAPFAPAGKATGQVYVIFGSKNFFLPSFNLTELNGSNGFTINGINEGDCSGYSLSQGDINGDNITDLLIGAPYAVSSDGQIYVVFGSRNPFPSQFNLAELSGNNGFAINGIDIPDENSAYSLSSGDINGDNIMDLLIGAPGAPHDSYKGQIYVIFGSKNLFPTNFHVKDINGHNGFLINGIGGSNISGIGSSLSSGDINGDNIMDLLIGVYVSAGNSGQSYVIFGAKNFTLSNLSSTSTPNYPTTGNLLTAGQKSPPPPQTLPQTTVLTLTLSLGISGICLIGSGIGVCCVVWRQKQKNNLRMTISKDSFQPSPKKISAQQELEVLPIISSSNEFKELSQEITLHTSVQSLKSPKSFIHTSTPFLEVSLNIPYPELSFTTELGRGGFGVVWKGIYNHTDVAIKQLHITNPPPDVLIEFQKEMQIMANLRSVYIVQLSGICNEPPCIIMQYLPKGSLYSVLHNKSIELDWSLRSQIAIDISYGLAFLHGKDVLHRDLKSLNVLLDKDYSAKLSDFGLSKLKVNASSLTKEEKVGTLAWMAPELFEPTGRHTAKSDMYSYGMVLAELASRDLPYKTASGNSDLIMKWASEEKHEELPPETPKKLASLIKFCWAAKPENRPTAAEALQQLTATDSAVAPDPDSSKEEVDEANSVVSYTGFNSSAASSRFSNN